MYIRTLELLQGVGRVAIVDNFVDKKPIKFIIGDTDSEPDVQKHINLIVDNIFKEKKIKMDSANITYTRWLGIKINHFFTDEGYWKQAVHVLTSNYGFVRVFFVIPEYKVFDVTL